ncbi:hypothetical protein RvY_09856 [Ramazzottius varieornatus]|uniref:Uncharacterized protein n=1 Tax=Ramazzottius varieornatus TaxID=947166 RepID=A0A1D1VJS2_RAMVA|nr:hypothetical protein RvY_09856 [Ramazzottius varieornatus]
MPLRSGRVLKLPRERSTTVPSKNKEEPKKKKQGTTPVEPASAVSPVRSPSPPIVLPSPPAPVLPLPTATAQTIPGEENVPPPVASKRFKRLNAKVTKTWLLEMFELDASTDVDRDGAIDCLFRHWLKENLEEQKDQWTKKTVHILAASVRFNIRLVFAQADFVRKRKR